MGRLLDSEQIKHVVNEYIDRTGADIFTREHIFDFLTETPEINLDKKISIPKVNRISQWDSRTRLIYKCRECETEFNFYGNYEAFCHICGCQQDWTLVPLSTNNKIAENYHNSDPNTQELIMIKLDEEIVKYVQQHEN